MGLGNIIGFSRMDLFTINELVLVHFLSISEFQILSVRIPAVRVEVISQI